MKFESAWKRCGPSGGWRGSLRDDLRAGGRVESCAIYELCILEGGIVAMVVRERERERERERGRGNNSLPR